jgi:hypothetical protein
MMVPKIGKVADITASNSRTRPDFPGKPLDAWLIFAQSKVQKKEIFLRKWFLLDRHNGIHQICRQLDKTSVNLMG